eukprot:2294381-Pyramimonas_sp.AAC.1
MSCVTRSRPTSAPPVLAVTTPPHRHSSYFGRSSRPPAKKVFLRKDVSAHAQSNGAAKSNGAGGQTGKR